jgi:hypothetical protein
MRYFSSSTRCRGKWGRKKTSISTENFSIPRIRVTLTLRHDVKIRLQQFHILQNISNAKNKKYLHPSPCKLHWRAYDACKWSCYGTCCYGCIWPQIQHVVVKICLYGFQKEVITWQIDPHLSWAWIMTTLGLKTDMKWQHSETAFLVHNITCNFQNHSSLM